MTNNDFSRLHPQAKAWGLGGKSDKAEMALSVTNITRRERRSGGQTNAQKAGIQRGDVIIGFGERTDRLTESGIIGYVLQEQSQAKALPVMLLRHGQKVKVDLSLE